MTEWYIREHESSNESCTSDACRSFSVLSSSMETKMGGHVSSMQFLLLSCISWSSWVDHKRLKQRPQFNLNYGHELSSDHNLKNAAIHVKASGLGHSSQ